MRSPSIDAAAHRGARALRPPSPRVESTPRYRRPALEEKRAEAAVAAREVEHLVALFQARPERDDDVGAPCRGSCAESAYSLVGPARRLAAVLVELAGSAVTARAAVSGMLADEAEPCRAQCQSVCRERKRLSITAA